jgi:hypothetical protein
MIFLLHLGNDLNKKNKREKSKSVAKNLCYDRFFDFALASLAARPLVIL